MKCNIFFDPINKIFKADR
ncbi:unnamed protein product [Larinioides sclopetarius]|uniref:Uncharacterized protein n=1 Tax=Larinioides sclopetarius TaxID=280406 RepID=A0AAV1Z5M9_9ARAC